MTSMGRVSPAKITMLSQAAQHRVYQSTAAFTEHANKWNNDYTKYKKRRFLHRHFEPAS